MRFVISLCLFFVFCVSVCIAEPYVVGPDGNPDTDYVVTRIMPALDGQIPRLEAVRNSVYGNGVVAAGVDNGILKVYRISNGIVTVLGTKSGYPSVSQVMSIRYDWTGMYNKTLYTSIGYDTDNDTWPNRTDFLEVSALGDFDTIFSFGHSTDCILFLFDFLKDVSGLGNGLYLLDRDVSDGTSFYITDNEFNLIKISQDFLPSGRTDLDIWGMKCDLTGRYGNKLTMVDWDDNNDQKSVIYQLSFDTNQWVWGELNELTHTNVRRYRDLAFSNGGSFGQQLYVTERYTNAVQAVEPDGSDSEFAKGFAEIESITVSDDGEHMYVSDANGVWHMYRGEAVEIGPEFVMREPKADVGGVHTDADGIDSVTLLFNDLIEFSNSDVEIVNESGESVSLSVTGSGSSFLIIAFGETLLNNKYSITVKDTVVSATTGNAIDGDSDGQAGGDYTFTMEHRRRHDSDNDNDIDMVDLAELAASWLWAK